MLRTPMIKEKIPSNNDQGTPSHLSFMLNNNNSLSFSSKSSKEESEPRARTSSDPVPIPGKENTIQELLSECSSIDPCYFIFLPGISELDDSELDDSETDDETEKKIAYDCDVSFFVHEGSNLESSAPTSDAEQSSKFTFSYRVDMEKSVQKKRFDSLTKVIRQKLETLQDIEKELIIIQSQILKYFFNPERLRGFDDHIAKSSQKAFELVLGNKLLPNEEISKSKFYQSCIEYTKANNLVKSDKPKSPTDRGRRLNTDYSTEVQINCIKAIRFIQTRSELFKMTLEQLRRYEINQESEGASLFDRRLNSPGTMGDTELWFHLLSSYGILVSFPELSRSRREFTPRRFKR